MKGIILYFSLTGNTKIALKEYDIVGFATYSEGFSICKYVKNYIDEMSLVDEKPAFVFSTYGRNNGAKKRVLAKIITKKRFKVVSDHVYY